jgi:hypothetical protein
MSGAGQHLQNDLQCNELLSIGVSITLASDQGDHAAEEEWESTQGEGKRL